MAIEINHLFESNVPDGEDNNLVQPSDWNANHVLSGGGLFRVPQLIEEKTLPAGTTSVTFSGLNGDSDREYLLDMDIIITGGGDYPVHLRFNSDDGSNYGSKILQYYASTGSITNFDYLRVASTGWNEASRVKSLISILATTGIKRRIKGNFTMVPASTDNMAWNEVWGYWKDTGGNITQIRLIPVTATISGVVRLYKMVDLNLGGE